MKTIKPILKLLFVALLVGTVMSRPQKARADYQVGPYQCSSQFESCQTLATETIGQCMSECFSSGGSDGTYTNLCYNDADVSAYDNGQFYTVYIDWETTCDEVPELTVSCAQTCINNYEWNMGNCVSQFCSLES